MSDETLRYATSISIGRDGDDDRRPYVLVARQYGTTSFPIRPWTVFDVTHDGGVHTASKVEFDDQDKAISFAWARLPVLRGLCPKHGEPLGPMSYGDGCGTFTCGCTLADE